MARYVIVRGGCRDAEAASRLIAKSDLKPSREHSHVPGSSLWPAGFTLGIAILLFGIIESWIAVAVGAVIAAVSAFLWVRRLASGGELLRTGEVVEPERRTPREQDEHVVPKKAASYKRSTFLEISTLGLSQVIGGLVTLPVLGFAVLPPFLKQGFKDHDVGPLSDFPESQWVVTTFMEDPSQGEVTRKTAFIRNNGFLGKLPSFTILSNHCAHLGCPVQALALLSSTPKEYKDVTLISMVTPPSGFACPCHGGAYDTEGNRTAGPPVRSLDRYSFSIRNGNLFLGAPFSVSKVDGTGANAKIHKWSLAFPGEPTGGLESWLYPIQPPH
jgi:menaquinol-cytochrome c reductase iron-sulfur subunit